MKIEVSNGEIVDKFTILEIKLDNSTDVEKTNSIQKELSYLKPIVDQFDIPKSLIDSLREVNKKLWDIEDSLRICESKFQFDDDFIQLARLVYYTNDRRFQLKKEVNNITNSHFSEEKIHPSYK
jgi:hypothetical protein